MITVNMHEAKTRLSKLIRQVVEQNEIVVVCRSGKPVAEIHPAADSQVNRLQCHPDLAPTFVKYDPTEPLSEDEWPAEYR